MPDVSIRRVSDLIREVEEWTLVLQPVFQRRLVWTNVVKDYFLETVSLGMPFPEIFIATGEIDTGTLKRKNLLVDGQQRISTLQQYVRSDPNLVLKRTKPFSELADDAKERFLNYPVAVRDLGSVTPEQVREIFSRINSSDFSLNAMERLNARFGGAYKAFCDKLSQHPFFDRHNAFSLADVRRMRDLNFCVILVTTLLSTYYDRDSFNKEYLERYNDEFPDETTVLARFTRATEFIERCEFPEKCRVWKKTDLFTLIVEVSHALEREERLQEKVVKSVLEPFYANVDHLFKRGPNSDQADEDGTDQLVFRYLKAATKATNDRYARAERGEIISSLIGTPEAGTGNLGTKAKRGKSTTTRKEKGGRPA